MCNFYCTGHTFASKLTILLAAMISNPMSTYKLYRNPRNKNAGNFMRLSDFLTFAKGKDLSGIMITVEVRN
jgi:hypothetical protein